MTEDVSVLKVTLVYTANARRSIKNSTVISEIGILAPMFSGLGGVKTSSIKQDLHLFCALILI